MTKTNPTEENFKKMDELLSKFFEDRDVKDQAKEEIQKVVDFKVVEGVMDNLPEEKHEEFMDLLVENQNDGEVVTKYLEEKGITKQVGAVLQRVSQDIVKDLEPDKETTTEIHSEGKVPVK